jgi:hypothetical protein
MSKLVTSSVAHPSSLVDNLVLNADGTVSGPGVGNLVAVKHALFTGVQTNSTAAGADFAVTNLSITHEVADSSNTLIISVFLGAAANSNGRSNVGLAVNDGTSLIVVGDADGSRTRVTSGGYGQTTGATFGTNNLAATFVHTPGAGSKTYTVRAINIDATTRTIFINRAELDTNDASYHRSASALVIQEVRA